MLRYIFLVFEQRRGEDQKTLGQLFMATSDELPDISFATALQYCIKELIAVVCEFIEIAEQLINTLVYEFFNRILLHYRQMLIGKCLNIGGAKLEVVLGSPLGLLYS